MSNHSEFIQYGRQTIDQTDIDVVADALKSSYLTTGPKVKEFEEAVCQLTGATHAFAVNSGTAALHCATRAIRLKPGDEVIIPAITFAATANCVLYEGATPIFCDVEPDTLNIDPAKIPNLITPNTKAIIMVDYAGQPPNYHAIKKICKEHNLILIEDAAHSIGHRVPSSICPHEPYIGKVADLTTFSFHPVKNMTTGEGGMIVTDNVEYADHIKTFRTHGISTEYGDRKLHGYDIVELGYNYRITDFQCALGINQLRRVPEWIVRRQKIATNYSEAFKEISNLLTPIATPMSSCFHIYVILLNLGQLNCDRDTIFKEIKDRNIGVNVHYKPVYLMTYYQNNPDLHTPQGLCPVAEESYERMITLPLFPTMTEDQISRVINDVKEVVISHALDTSN